MSRTRNKKMVIPGKIAGNVGETMKLYQYYCPKCGLNALYKDKEPHDCGNCGNKDLHYQKEVELD